MSHNILIIDDEADIRDVLADIFEDEGYNVLKAAHSEQAFSTIQKQIPDLIVLDIWLENSDMDGIEILKTLKKKDSEWKDIPVLMISGHGNIEMAVNAMKIGAYDFIEKPFKIDHILLTVQRALEQRLLKQENTELKDKINIVSTDYKTKSPKLLSLLKSITDNQSSDARVLILGETGTGKSKLARYVHKHSTRSTKPLHSFFANELSADTINHFFTESDFQTSTILIERIENLSKENQSLLLKHLSHPDLKTLPRIISSGPSNMKKIIDEGSFSSALYDRLAVFVYDIPPLKERLDDLPEMISDFTDGVCKFLNGQAPTYASDTLLLIENHDWKGNIRQLKCAIEWVTLNHVLNKEQRPISAKDMIGILSHAKDDATSDNTSPNAHQHAEGTSIGEWLDLPLRDARESFEKLYLSSLIKRFRGNISQMAGHIDMERTALHRKLKSLDIRYDEIAHKIAERKAG